MPRSACGAVEGKRGVEVVVDDDDGDLEAHAVDASSSSSVTAGESPSNGSSRKHAHVTGQRAGSGDHCCSPGQIVGRHPPPVRKPQKNADALVTPVDAGAGRAQADRAQGCQ
jgi:hypothetical protein